MKIALLALAAVLAAGSRDLAVQIAPPSGPLAIERVEYRWTDTARGRELPVHLWHPSALASRAWPVVIFSHGAGTPATRYLAKLQDLASHGYIVVAPEYPADSPDALRRCQAPAGTAYDEMVEVGMRCLRERAEAIANDIRFVIDRAGALNGPRGESPQLQGRLDLARVAAIGHSLGGFASVRACQLDARIAACVNEDGGTADGAYLQYADANGLKQPLLYVEASVPPMTDQQLAASGMTREDWNARLDRMFNIVHERQLRSAGQGSYKVVLHAPGMQHLSFGDLYLTAATEDARRVALHNLALCEEVTRAFLDKRLNGATATLLDATTPQPEITVQRY